MSFCKAPFHLTEDPHTPVCMGLPQAPDALCEKRLFMKGLLDLTLLQPPWPWVRYAYRPLIGGNPESRWRTNNGGLVCNC